MKAIKNIFSKKWLLELIAVLIISVLIWFIAPLIAIAGSVLLETVLSRLIAIAVVFSIWLLYRLIKHLSSKKREQQLISQLSGADAGQGQSADLLVLSRKFQEAITLLKASRKAGGKQYLYELPWYAIIGAPGSGKTTALINSGLHFPLAEQLGKKAIKGVSGTRDCDWWFTDQAVLIDTAGRFATQDSNQEVDATAWYGFLQLLKKYRPRRPLNGVFITVSISDLIQQTEAESLAYAKAIRLRIKELNGQLGINLPIYLLFTKTDIVAGFTDFFADLTEIDRQQVWGETFESLAVTNESLNLNLESFETGFDELIDRLTARRIKRLQEERDLHRRSLIFDFPQQMSLVKPLLIQFLHATFSTSSYESAFHLRGVYFTSGTQEGTPIDRIMSVLANTFKLESSSSIAMTIRGKSYFLTKLLKEVVFPEAELVGVDQIVERRFRFLKLATFGGTIAVIGLAVLIWSVSFTTNKIAIAEIENQIQIYQASKIDTNDTRSYFLTLLPKLNALLAAKQVYQQTGWSSGFGLYQGDKLESGANIAYERLLRETFLPLISNRLIERMQSSEGNNLDVLYQLLGVYLMLAQPAHMDAKVATPWIKVDWESLFITDADVQAKLQIHLDNLLALNLDPAPIDNNFVTAARAKLLHIPQVNQIYSRFRTESTFAHDHDLVLLSALAPNGDSIYSTYKGNNLQTVIVPALFTNYGYVEYFLKKGMDYVKEANAQNWVLGGKSDNNILETDRLYGDFKRLYLAEYQKTWDGILSTVKLKPQLNNNQLIDTLDLLSRSDSPLKLLLILVEKNTTLSNLSAELAASKTGLNAAVPSSVQNLLAKATANYAGSDPIKDLETHFEPYNVLVRGAPDKPVPLDNTLISLKNLHDKLLSVSLSSGDSAGGGGAASLDALNMVKKEGAHLPSSVAASLTALTSTGSDININKYKNELNEALKTAVNGPCKNLLTGRYPFTKSSQQDVLLADFAKLFAVNGIFDQYFATYLKPLVDTTAVHWQEMSSEKALGLSIDTIAQFQTAARIRDAFFSGSANLPQVQFELKPTQLDDRIGTFRLNIEGQELIYRHGPEQITSFKWPGISSNVGVRISLETLENKLISRQKDGAWALFRLFDEFNIERTNLPERFNFNVQIEGYTARFELRAASVDNPFGITEFQKFRCPESL